LISNILEINSLDSRFWRETNNSVAANLFCFNNLTSACKKICIACSFGEHPGLPFLSLGGKIRSGTLPNGFTSAAVRDQFHLLALRAGALQISEAVTRTMATAQADVAIFRPAQHAPELAV
jgi:hypothetical protein